MAQVRRFESEEDYIRFVAEYQDRDIDAVRREYYD